MALDPRPPGPQERAMKALFDTALTLYKMLDLSLKRRAGLKRRAQRPPTRSAAMGVDDIRALARAGERQTLELKPEIESQTDIGVLLASFTNADGETVLFGVTDDGAAMGITKPPTLVSRIRAAARSCRPPLSLNLSVYEVTVVDRTVGVAQVLAVQGQLYSYNEAARQDDE